MNYFQFPCRLYSGPKDSAYFTILSSSAYEKIMKYNVDQELSFNRYWIKRLSLFVGKWKSQISQIDIGINDYIHKDHKNQIGLVFQLFVYILQQFKWNLLKKQVLWKASALNKNYLTEVSRNQFLYKFS